jgi:hypothetical protein
MLRSSSIPMDIGSRPIATNSNDVRSLSRAGAEAARVRPPTRQPPGSEAYLAGAYGSLRCATATSMASPSA